MVFPVVAAGAVAGGTGLSGASIAGLAAGGATLLGGMMGGEETESGLNDRQIGDGILFIKQHSNQAMKDLIHLLPQMDETRYAGLNQMLDLKRQTLPGMMDALTLGQRQAQQTQAGGLTQRMNALMGRPVDTGFAQPRVQKPDLSYMDDIVLPKANWDADPIMDRNQENLQKLAGQVAAGGQ